MAPLLWKANWLWGYIVAMTVGHFFLFCNVFRISRALELTWAGAFIAIVFAIAEAWIGWHAGTVLVLTVTAVLIVVEMHKPSCHGVLWRRINPGLPTWWESVT